MLLLLPTQTHGTRVKLEVLNLSVVRLLDTDVPELQLYLSALPHLNRVKLSSSNCNVRIIQSAGRMRERVRTRS